MKIIWKYLNPFRNWLFLAMGLASLAQVLELIDPIIFGKIIDNFAVNTDGRSQEELVRGVLRLLALAIGIALLARLAHAFTDYFTRLVVQKFGLSVFDEGLKHTLRLPYSEFEETSSGHLLSLLHKVPNPKVLIFDEATSALDSLTEEQITDALREISAGKKQIILMIAHRLSTIMHADRIYVLEKGKIVEEGNHDTLLDIKGLYYAMWRQQIGEHKSVSRYTVL